MPRQRWYAGGGHTPVLSLVAQWDAPVSDPNTRVFALLVEDTRARERTVYHVPLVERRGGAPHPGAIIGVPREGGSSSTAQATLPIRNTCSPPSRPARRTVPATW